MAEKATIINRNIIWIVINIAKQMMQYQQPPLDQTFQNHVLGNKVLNFCYILIILLNCSFMLQIVSSLDVVFASIVITLAIGLELSYINTRLANNTPIQIIFNPIVCSIGIFGIIIALEVPYYSVMISAPIAVILGDGLYAYIFKKQIKLNQFLLLVSFLFIALLVLSHQRILKISLAYFITPMLILTIFCLCLMDTYLIKTGFKRIFSKTDRIYRGYLRFIYFAFLVNYLVLNLTLYLSKIFISEDIFFRLLKISTMFCSFLVVLMVVFLQQIIITVYFLKYQVAETVFRVQNRRFIEFYNQDISQKNLLALENDCFLCDGKARIIELPCGHLNLCKDCHQKKIEKLYYFCIACRKHLSFRCKSLNYEQSVKRKGFKRKFFLQKKLCKNQFLAN